ncbi:MAG: gold resistance metallochaperone GolB [Chloroflexi bacterium OHK40]
MYTFKVQDMTCGGCASSVRKAVSQVSGVSSVTADPQTKDVVVEASPEVTREAVVAAIQDAGYNEITVVETAR